MLRHVKAVGIFGTPTLGPTELYDLVTPKVESPK